MRAIQRVLSSSVSRSSIRYMSSSPQRAASSRVSYPRPAKPSSTAPIVPPPPYIPYSPPPQTSTPPRLPIRPSVPALPSGWTRTSHIIPAAYPRRFADSFGSLTRESKPFELDPPKEGESKDERLARNEGEARECVRRRFDAKEHGGEEAGEAEEGREGLYMAGERWVREGVDKGAEGVTLVVTHANGFTKESWHPALKRLLDMGAVNPADTFGDGSSVSTTSTSVAPLQVDEIWLFDDIHHAASIDLNAGRIGPVHGWSEGGRDIVNFLQHIYRGPRGQYGDQKVLGWQKDDQSRGRRKVIGVGHSVGGNALVQAVAEDPSLFHALFLVEPMCPAHAPPRSTLRLDGNFAKSWPLVMGASKRRTEWPTLVEAAKVRSAPFFASWHEDVWQLYLEHGLVPLGEQGEAVQLATPSWAEGCVFGEPTGIAEGWDRLPQLEIPVGFLMAGDSRATQGDKVTGEMVWRPKRASNERIMDGGHLLVHEKPDEVAQALHRFMGSLAASLVDIHSRSADLKARL